jgi:hypothetical protein
MKIKLTLAAVVLTLSTAAAQPPAGGPVEAKYVTPTFVAAVVFEPARLDKAAKDAGLPAAEVWKVIEGFSGTEVKQFERVTFLVEPFPGGNVAFMPAFVLRYPAGTDARKQLAPLLGGDVTEAKVGDIAYVRSTKYKLAKVEMAGYAIDDRTLLVAAWPTLEPMLKPGGEKDKDRALAAELAKADLAHDAVVIFTPAPALKRIAELEKESGKPTDMPYYKEVKAALERTAAITITLDLGKETLIRAEFRCDNAAGAGVVHDTLKDLLGKAKEAYPAVRKDLEKQFDFAKPLLLILDETVNNHKLTKDGNTVVLTVARPKELTPKK